MTQPTAPLKPSWPQELTSETPLPYHLWKVLDQVNGRQSVTEVARLAGVSEGEVLQALTEAEQRAQSYQRLIRPVDDELQRQITRLLGGVVGPIASVLVEEAMEDLGGSPRAGDVFRRLSGELEPAQRAEFGRQAREQGLA